MTKGIPGGGGVRNVRLSGFGAVPASRVLLAKQVLKGLDPAHVRDASLGLGRGIGWGDPLLTRNVQGLRLQVLPSRAAPHAPVVLVTASGAKPGEGFQVVAKAPGPDALAALVKNQAAIAPRLSKALRERIPAFHGVQGDWAVYGFVPGLELTGLRDSIHGKYEAGRGQGKEARDIGASVGNLLAEVARARLQLGDVHFLEGHNCAWEKETGTVRLFEPDALTPSPFPPEEELARTLIAQMRGAALHLQEPHVLDYALSVLQQALTRSRMAPERLVNRLKFQPEPRDVPAFLEGKATRAQLQRASVLGRGEFLGLANETLSSRLVQTVEKDRENVIAFHNQLQITGSYRGERPPIGGVTPLDMGQAADERSFVRVLNGRDWVLAPPSPALADL